MRKMRTVVVVTGLGLMMCMSGCAKNEPVKTEAATTQEIIDYVETTAETETGESLEETGESLEETGENAESLVETEEVQLPEENSWVNVGGVERQFENFKATMPNGYKYMGFNSGISSFSKEVEDKLLTTLVWYQSTGASESTESLIDFSTMGTAELAVMSETMGKALVEKIGNKVSDISTSIETINGSNYVAVTFKNDDALGYFVFTLSKGNLQGVITVTDMTKEDAESTTLEVLNNVEFNGQACEPELNIQFISNIEMGI